MNKYTISNDKTDDGYNGNILLIPYSFWVEEISNFYKSDSFCRKKSQKTIA